MTLPAFRVAGGRLAQPFAFPRHPVLPRQFCHPKRCVQHPQICFQTTYAQPPPRSSLTYRILRSAAVYVAITISAFTIGAYAAIHYAPNREALRALVNPPTVTNEETLSLFQPPDEASAIIDRKILSCPLATELRANSAFTASRPHMKIPDAVKPTNLTGGTLAGPGKITVPPLAFNEEGGKSMMALFYLGPQLCGHPGIIHGGLLATMLDEGLARCCFPAFPSKVGVTAHLKITYSKPARADRYYALRAETQSVQGRKAWVKGWIEELDCDGQVAARDENGEKVRMCEAEALFVEPRNANMIKRMYTGAT